MWLVAPATRTHRHRTRQSLQRVLRTVLLGVLRLGRPNASVSLAPGSPGALADVFGDSLDSGSAGFSVILLCEPPCPQEQRAWVQGKGAGLWAPESSVPFCRQLVQTRRSSWARAVPHDLCRHTGTTPQRHPARFLGGLKVF